jgi:hypothetical protein
VDFNNTVKTEVSRAGYLAAFTCIPGLNFAGTDPLEIRRLPLDGRWTHEESETRISGLLEAIRK